MWLFSRKKKKRQTSVKKDSKTSKKQDKEKRQTRSLSKNDIVNVEMKKHKDKQGGHQHFILGTDGNKHISVGTQTKPSKGTGKLKRLDIDPLGQGKTVYMRREATVDKVSNYRLPKRGVMTKENYDLAKAYAEKKQKKR